MQCYRGSCLFPSTETTSLEHEHMGRHKGLPSLGTRALTFSRSYRAHFSLSLRGWPLAPSNDTWATANSPKLIFLLPLRVAGQQEGKQWRVVSGNFELQWWRGEGKWHGVRNWNHPMVSTHSLRLWTVTLSLVQTLSLFRSGSCHLSEEGSKWWNA